MRRAIEETECERREARSTEEVERLACNGELRVSLVFCYARCVIWRWTQPRVEVGMGDGNRSASLTKPIRLNMSQDGMAPLSMLPG